MVRKKNGELLELMRNNSFELFVTVDRNLSYQQNLTKQHIIIFVLCTVNNQRETFALLIPGLFERLASGNLQNVNEIYEKDGNRIYPSQ